MDNSKDDGEKLLHLGKLAGISSPANVFDAEPEPCVQGTSSELSKFSNDLSQMPDNPRRIVGHRRAHSEVLTLPDDISFDSDLGVVGGADGPFSDETGDLFSMYLDMEKAYCSSTSAFQFDEPSSSCSPAQQMVEATLPQSAGQAKNTENVDGLAGLNEKPRTRHQHSLSMDGSMTVDNEMLTSGSEEVSGYNSKKAMSDAKLAELALIDPKRAKRIWANRQSAARSKERKMRYIAELERKLQTLQTEGTTFSTQVTLLQRDTNGLAAENSELKLRLQTMEQQIHLQDDLNDSLKEEIQHLKMLTGQGMHNGGSMMNLPLGSSISSSSSSSSFHGNQPYYPNSRALHALLTAQQLQQLQLCPQKQQQHQPNLQQQQQQLRQLQQQKWQQQINHLQQLEQSPQQPRSGEL